MSTGEYLWNNGMLIWKISFLLKFLAEHLPEHYEKLSGVFLEFTSFGNIVYYEKPVFYYPRRGILDARSETKNQTI